MNQTQDWLLKAKDEVCKILESLTPQLLAAYGQEKYTDKPDLSIVTELDRLVEESLKEGLTKFDSSIGFFGEETGKAMKGDTFWLVDPIDGTEWFVRGVPQCTNLIALVSNGEVVMSVVNAFAEDKHYWAIKGGGAFCNGQPIHVNDRPLHRAMVELETNVTTPEGNAMLQAIRQPIWGYVQLCAPGYMHASIASGRHEGRIHYHGYGHEWDYAAGSLLISEAGGKVANIGSDKYDYADLSQIAATPQVFDVLHEIASKVASQF